jgi:hypothetical protein
MNAQTCVFQSDAGLPYYLLWKFQPQAGTVQGPRLKVVAFGDSVVWGDGDKPEHRIVSLVSQNLSNDIGRPVELHSYAHSGARLQYAPDASSMVPLINGSPVPDVDAARPTTEEQAVCAKIEDSDADYVLMDGCINEVGATNIALPPTLGLNKTTPAEIRAIVLYYCAAPMRNVLEEVLSDFPQAKIVLLNYFLVVSAKSQPKPEVESWTVAQKNAQQMEIDRALRKAASLEGATNDRSLTTEEIEKRTQPWAANSEEFLADTTSCFEWAIASASAGGQEPATAESPESDKPVCRAYRPDATPPTAARRILLAQVSSNPKFSYGAPDSHLWLLPDPLLHPDEMFGVRNSECDRTHYLQRNDQGCKINPIAHPKPAGAQCYAKSILTSLGMPWNPPAGQKPANCSDE